MARRLGRLAGVLVIILLASLVVALKFGLIGAGSARSSVSLPPPTAGDSFQPVLGVPASGVAMIGTSSAGAAAWALGSIGPVPAIVNGKQYANQRVLLEHTGESGWRVVPLPLGPSEHPLSPSTGGSTANGGYVLITDGGVVTGDPGGEPRLALEPEAGLLGEEESVPPKSSTTPYAAIEDSGHTGVLVAPAGDGKHLGAGILHYDGQVWTREPLKGPSAETADQLTPEAIACGGVQGTDESGNSPTNCWLLAAYTSEAPSGALDRMALFRRVLTKASTYEWREVVVEDGESPLLGELAPASETRVTPLGSGTQMLTATAQGVWVDLQMKIGLAGASLDVSKLVVPASSNTAKSLGTWCFGAVGAICSAERTYAGLLPGEYHSFAWPASGSEFGVRIITGLKSRAMLELAGESFSEIAGAGGMNGPAPGAAAFAEPDQGFLADEVTPNASSDGQGQASVIEVTTHPSGDELGAEPVPFRRPLYAVAQTPGSVAGDPHAEAFAVGETGEVARWVPGQGWRSESLYNSAGKVQTPTLRGVAWPTPGRAYAVGDNGAMWMWQAATGLWSPDPGKPVNFIGHLAAIAFSAVNPNIGYAVGRQGVLLRFGKSWEQEPLPPELQGVNFTSVTFAGNEGLATYRTLNGLDEVGGIAVREGGGQWHVDAGVSALLAELPSVDTVFSRVAGLADGGVVAAGPGLVIERDSTTSKWRFSPQPLPAAQNISALAAYRDPSGAIRAVASIDLDGFLNPQQWDGNLLYSESSPFGRIDVPPVTAEGALSAQLPPDLLPNSGYVLKETASGWLDMEHEALPDTGTNDRPDRPDPVLGLLVSPSGSSGMAVGGQTGDIEGLGVNAGLNAGDFHHQTAAAMRFPAGDASANGASAAPIPTTAGKVSFAVAAQANCSAPCADFVREGIGPEAWLAHALASANHIATGSPGGLRAFLYAGSLGGSEDVFSRYLSRYQEQLPAYGADSGGVGVGEEPGPAGTAAYSFLSEGAGGGVRVIVLDTSKLEAQFGWVEGTLRRAREAATPAIVVGGASLGFTLPEPYGPHAVELAPTAASTLSTILIHGGASAYFFDYPESNVHAEVSEPGFAPLRVYGTGTLGYITPSYNTNGFNDALGSSGFLVAELETAARNPATNVAPVSVKVVPNISQLALDASDGVLLRRSHVALFEALARRADGGAAVGQTAFGVEWTGPDPYDAIPFDCQGPNCRYEVPIDYKFSSSNPDIGDFVAHDSSSSDAHQVLLGANKLPVPDPRSGLFCAFNAGTTTVSISTGGLTYSEPVTVQAGSVEYPCGTVPLKNPPLLEVPVKESLHAPELPTGAPSNTPQIQTLPPPPPPVPARVHPKVPPPPVFSFFPILQPHASATLAIVPPPPPLVGRPIPPSGTSQVVDEKREEESATEMAHTNSAAMIYRPEERSGPGPWLLLLVVIAAGAGVGVRRGRRGDAGQRPAFARATTRRRRF